MPGSRCEWPSRELQPYRVGGAPVEAAKLVGGLAAQRIPHLGAAADRPRVAASNHDRHDRPNGIISAFDDLNDAAKHRGFQLRTSISDPHRITLRCRHRICKAHNLNAMRCDSRHPSIDALRAMAN